MIYYKPTLYSLTITESPTSSPQFNIRPADQPSLHLVDTSALEVWMQVQLPIFVRHGPGFWNPRASAGDEAFGFELPEVRRRIAEMRKGFEEGRKGHEEVKVEEGEGREVKEEEEEKEGSQRGEKYERGDEAFELRGGKKRKAMSEEPKKRAKVRFEPEEEEEEKPFGGRRSSTKLQSKPVSSLCRWSRGAGS